MMYLTFMAGTGGFLFGYDTGVVSGAMLPIKRSFALTPQQQEVFVSSTIGAAFLSSLCLAAPLNDRYGRRIAILCAAFIFGVGSVLLMVANSYPTLVCGRIILGIGIGIASLTTPIYIAEMSTANLRGRLVTVNTFMITFGQFFAGMVDGILDYFFLNQGGWRYMLGFAVIPSIIMFVGFLSLPESPRYLIQKGHYQQAFEILTQYRESHEDAYTEVHEIIQSLHQQQQQNYGGGTRTTTARAKRKVLSKTKNGNNNKNIDYTTIAGSYHDDINNANTASDDDDNDGKINKNNEDGNNTTTVSLEYGSNKNGDSYDDNCFRDEQQIVETTTLPIPWDDTTNTDDENGINFLISDVVSNNNNAHGHGNSVSLLWEMLSDGGMRQALRVGCGLMIVQQCSGINTVMYYAASIYEMAGYKELTAVWLSGLTALAQVIGIVLSIVFVDKAGRRTLVLYSLGFVALSLTGLASSFYLLRITSGEITSAFHSNIEDHDYASATSTAFTATSLSSCDYQPAMIWDGITTYCFDCVGIDGCGYCNGVCIPGDILGPTRSATIISSSSTTATTTNDDDSMLNDLDSVQALCGNSNTNASNNNNTITNPTSSTATPSEEEVEEGISRYWEYDVCSSFGILDKNQATTTTFTTTTTTRNNKKKNPYGIVSVICMILYLLSFGIGMGGMPWTINSELYPLKYRALAVSLSTSTNWMGNLLVSATFLSLSSPAVFTSYGAFALYGTVALLGWIWLYRTLPETKGLSLEQIEALFSQTTTTIPIDNDDDNDNDTGVHVRDGGSHGRHRGYDGRIRLPTQEILEHTTILE